MDWDSDDDLFNEAAELVDKTSPTSNENSNEQPTASYINELRKNFGHNSFRPMQWEIIKTVLFDKRDQCVLMATGSGKSLCFQFPSVFTGGVTVVISPLISLMEDQVLSLTVSGIPACYLGSAQTKSSEITINILKNKYRLVYLTPEFCNGDSGAALLDKMLDTLEITLIAIDEAHCISKWGHDFRSSYRTLGKLRDILPNIPILAVTATATETVQTDICKALKMNNPALRLSTFDRPNLCFEVYPKTSVLDDIQKCLRDIDGSVIIYTLTKKEAENICEILKFNKINCGAYHAGMALTKRKEIHEKFTRDELKIIVATVAFGMGIDKPDVRVVIHYGASKDLESYYQEVGRAGRDGLPSKCITFYSAGDFVTHEVLRSHSSNQNGLQHLRELGQHMKNFIYSTECRRKKILEYFANKNSKTVELTTYDRCCDNCINSKKQSTVEYNELDEKGLFDFTLDTQLFLETVQLLNGRYGVVTYVKFLRGSKIDKIYERYKLNKLYGGGKKKSEVWWKIVARLVEQKGFLKKVSFQMGCTVQLSTKGTAYLKDIRESKSKDVMKLTPPSDVLPFLTKKVSDAVICDSDDDGEPILFTKITNSRDLKQLTHSTKPVISARPVKNDVVSDVSLYKQSDSQERKDFNTKLFSELKNYRNDIAHEMDCMPYMVSSDIALMEMVNILPTSLNTFIRSKFNNFNETKIRKFGPKFTNFIKNYVTKHGTDELKLKIDNIEELASSGVPLKEALVYNPYKGSGPLNHTTQATLDMFLRGMTLEKIAEIRKFAPSTIQGHLKNALGAGYPLKLIDHLKLDPEIIEETLKVFAAAPVDLIGMLTLTYFKEKLPESVDWLALNCIHKYIDIRQHLQSQNVDYSDHDPEHFQKFLSLRDLKSSEQSSSLAQEVDKENDSSVTKEEAKIKEIPGTSFYKSPSKPSTSREASTSNKTDSKRMSSVEQALVDALNSLVENETLADNLDTWSDSELLEEDEPPILKKRKSDEDDDDDDCSMLAFVGKMARR